MAIRSIAQLKAWFKRGAYPTAEQFADWLDSFFHKDEKVPVSSVDGLAERLNAKYDRNDGLELERKHNELADEFAGHKQENGVDFSNTWEAIHALEDADEALLASLGGQPYMVDAQYSADGTNVTVTYVKYNAATSEQVTITRQFPVVTETDAGLMSAEVYQLLLTLNNEVLELKAQGGRFIGQSFTTKAALDAYAIPATVNPGDFTYVMDDETQQDATTRYIAATVDGALKFVFGYIINYDPVGFATLTQAGVVKSSKTVGKVMVEADGTMSVVGWDAMGERITQAVTNYQRDDAAIRLEIAAIQRVMMGILAETAGRVIPLKMEVAPPSRITMGNTVRQYIKAALLPTFALQNVMFLSDEKAVDVEPDGAVNILGLGKSKVRVIPTENTALFQTVEIEVVNPSFLTQSNGGLLLAGDNILLT